jgi:hypothetical protein
VAELEALPSATVAAVAVTTEMLQFVETGRLLTLPKEPILAGEAVGRESKTTRAESLRVPGAKVRLENVGGDGIVGMIAALRIRHNHAVAAVNHPRK